MRFQFFRDSASIEQVANLAIRIGALAEPRGIEARYDDHSPGIFVLTAQRLSKHGRIAKMERYVGLLSLIQDRLSIDERISYEIAKLEQDFADHLPADKAA